MKICRNIIICLVVVVFLASIGGGVFCMWYYANGGVKPAQIEMDFELGDFLWEGSGNLPTEDGIGKNHVTLIDNIINHAEHGLNSPNSYLNEQIEKRQDGGLGWRGGRDTLGSMAVTQSQELSEIFGLEAAQLDFLIQFKSDTEYYLFTTGVYLGERGAVNILGMNTSPGKPTVTIGEPIYPIYKTVLRKTNGNWEVVSTEEGYALSAWYEESRSNANATQIPSFDPDTFVASEP